MKGLEVLKTSMAQIDRVLDNHELETMVETSDEWIVSRTGIHERRIASVSSAALAIDAAKKAIEDIDQSKIGLIVVATMTPECATPSNACLVQEALGLNNQQVMCFDISAACSGFVYALTIVNALLETMDDKYALVIGSEKLSDIIDFQDRNTCVLFGDGAGAMVVKKSDHMFISYNDAAGVKDTLYANRGGDDPYLHMDGKDVFKFAVKAIPLSIDHVLEEANLTLDDIDYVVCHQANYRIIKHVYKKYRCDPQKFYMNLQSYGNTSAASIPLALAQMDQEGLLKKKMKVICVGFGGGLTWGATLMEW